MAKRAFPRSTAEMVPKWAKEKRQPIYASHLAPGFQAFQARATRSDVFNARDCSLLTLAASWVNSDALN